METRTYTANLKNASLPIDFSAMTAETLNEYTIQSISFSKQIMEEMISISNTASFETSFLRMDDLFNQLGRAHNLLDLLSYVSPDESIRQQAMKSLAETGKMFNEISLNVELYKALKPVYEKNKWVGWQQRLADKIIKSFERNGCNLDETKRAELKKIKDRISDLGIAFSNNIDSEHHEFRFTAQQIEGLPESYLQQRKQPDGTFLVTLDYPDYHPFMKYCKSDESRKKLYTAFTTRAAANKEVLKELISLRNQMARMTGYKSFAEFSIDDNVAKTPEAVWQFENNLKEKVKDKAKKDYALLMEIKKNTTGDDSALMPWQSSYYTEKLMESAYQINSEKLREYFPLNSVLKGIFTICEKLFEVKIIEINNQPVWHEEVRFFEVISENKTIAGFYLDLFPRKNKFSHAACFGITAGKLLSDGSYQKPCAALVCNFPKPQETTPSLLTHDDVETMFHEFGHLVHHLLTKSPVYYFSGTNTAIDFVEVPSQLFENWAWDYESLKLFAHHYKTGETLPEDLHKRMIDSRNVNSGIFLLQQVFYASLDMTYHDGYDLNKNTTTDAVRNLMNSITLFPYLEGTHFETSFGHLKDYAAGYYSYMWSRVYADDMYYQIKKEGLLNPEAGRKYLHDVLEKGATVDESIIVKNFLGREAQFDAFLRHNGIID
ncbi:MAG: Zn-dependent oligopeptidase [Bacteroidia bacterium]|nr:Zn-dependent oligopeptidase [Bacteroidia bacterium]